MGLRVPGLFKPKRSSQWWFRMAVPERLRAVVGKREILQTLGTADVALARTRHALKLAETRAWFASLEQQHSASIEDRAAKIVDVGFRALVDRHLTYNKMPFGDRHQAVDNVTHTMLTMLAYRLQLDWGGDYAARAQRAKLPGEKPAPFALEPPLADDAFATFKHRDLAMANMELFEGHRAFKGAAVREIARALLAARQWHAAEFEVLIVAEASGAQVGTRGPLFDAIAAGILRRLAKHRFAFWPEDVDHVLTPMMTSMAAHLPTTAHVDPPKSTGNGALTTLTDCLAVWKMQKKISDDLPNQTADEWRTAIQRFKELMGTEDLRAIDREMVEGFVDDVSQLPFRPKKPLRSAPLRDQIAAAHDQRLATLSGPTIGKQLGGVRRMLQLAVDKGVLAANPAAGITVEDSKHLGTERDRFSDEDMRLIYGAPLMTDPDACSDTMFWILFLAPFHGSRPGEHCKLKPADIDKFDGEWVMRFRSDRRRKASGAKPETRPRRQKNDTSVRDVPLHWIVIEGGFLDYVDLKIEQGAEWDFDDLAVNNKYGDRYKQLSRQINARLRALGITATDKSFYSSRHSMKREGRRAGVSNDNLDQLTGHASGRVGLKYGQGTPLSTLKHDIDCIDFPTVAWDPVVACAHRRLARMALNMQA